MTENAEANRQSSEVFQRIMIAVDESAAAADAAHSGLRLAQALHAEVIFATVVFIQIDDMAQYPAAQEEKRLAEARALLSGFVAQAANVGIKARSVVREGEPAPELLRAAEEEAVDLIVTGTHGRRGVPRFFLGSVAEALARQAPCPILLVREPVHRKGQIEHGTAAPSSAIGVLRE